MPPSAIARWTRRSRTSAVFAAASATSTMLEAEKVSITPRAPVVASGGTSTAIEIAGKTAGCTRGITRRSMSAPVETEAPASTAAVTAATSPPTTTMYLPEQIVRASSSSTGAALSIASWAR